MYPGTKVNIYEKLAPKSNQVNAANESLPLFLCMFSSEKGTEDITTLGFDDFKKMYGETPNFTKYGQPLEQTHRILAAGGRVLGKRIVASDSTLGYIVITAHVSIAEQQMVDAQNRPLYRTSSGELTTTAEGNTAATNSVATVKYKAENATGDGKTNFAQVEAYAKSLLNTTTGVYPLFIVADNGRGASIKKVKIEADYNTSKALDYVMYKISSIENINTIETAKFAVAPDAVGSVNGTITSLALTETTCSQIVAKTYTDGLKAYITKLTSVGLTEAELYEMDPIFGKTKGGESVSEIVVDTTPTEAEPWIIAIDTTYGNALATGNDGDFTDSPWSTDTTKSLWATQAIKFLQGDYSEAIFDLDMYKIDFCVDADYPYPTGTTSTMPNVKNAIIKLAEFREDFMYFRDFGLGNHKLTDIQGIINDSTKWKKSRYAADYSTNYDIIDYYSKKQVQVTMTHGLAPLLVNHYTNNPASPLAGEINNMVITEAIPGTITFIPRITPNGNQKEIMDNLHVNYCNYSSDGSYLTIQSSYTSQATVGPLSYISNVIITQKCIKDIRRYCPKIRFMTVDGADFSSYKALIEDNVIANYTRFFQDIKLVYNADDDQINQKTFYASLYCWYKNFAQGEIFDVFAMEGTPETNPIA